MSVLNINDKIWLQAFVVNLIIAMVAICPIIILNQGLFTLEFDFSAQEIPFQLFMHDAVRSGNILWNWGIDLGGNFLESFGFYNLGSPFAWISILLPKSLIPYAIVNARPS